MSVMDRVFDTRVADANLRAMKPGDVWTVPGADGKRHHAGIIRPGCGSAFILSNVVVRCGITVLFTGHATPGRPTCSTCAIEIPSEVIAAAKREPFIHLRAKDLDLRRPIVCDGAVVGFCHPHDTPSGFRLGPIFVLPAYRGRGLTRAAYAQHAAGRRCFAYIHTGNVGSEKAHAAAGFKLVRTRRGGTTWVREA